MESATSVDQSLPLVLFAEALKDRSLPTAVDVLLLLKRRIRSITKVRWTFEMGNGFICPTSLTPDEFSVLALLQNFSKGLTINDIASTFSEDGKQVLQKALDTLIEKHLVFRNDLGTYQYAE